MRLRSGFDASSSTDALKYSWPELDAAVLEQEVVQKPVRVRMAVEGRLPTRTARHPDLVRVGRGEGADVDVRDPAEAARVLGRVALQLGTATPRARLDDVRREKGSP